MTSSNRNIFRVTGPLCGEFTGPGEFLTQRPVTRSFDVFFDLRLNKRLSKQPWGWWFETPPWSLWRQCNGLSDTIFWCLPTFCMLTLDLMAPSHYLNQCWLLNTYILWHSLENNFTASIQTILYDGFGRFTLKLLSYLPIGQLASIWYYLYPVWNYGAVCVPFDGLGQCFS